MPANVEQGGLCSTCNNAAACKFSRDPRKPVLYCEQFDTSEPVSVETTRRAETQPAPMYPPQEEDSARFMGLCSNCENCESCMFPKPEGGIWHCEEYR